MYCNDDQGRVYQNYEFHEAGVRGSCARALCVCLCVGRGDVIMLLSSAIVDYYLINRWACYASMHPSDQQKSV